MLHSNGQPRSIGHENMRHKTVQDSLHRTFSQQDIQSSPEPLSCACFFRAGSIYFSRMFPMATKIMELPGLFDLAANQSLCR